MIRVLLSDRCMPPTFDADFDTFLYLVLCHKLSMVVMDFTKKVDAIPADTFLRNQSWFFKKHLAITDATESLQSVFSLSSFCLCL